METERDTFETEIRRSSWGCLKYVGLAALLLALFVALGMIGMRFKNAGKLQSLVAEMDRTDPGWRLEAIEAAREAVPEEENSARVVMAAAERLPKKWPSADFHEENLPKLPPNEKLNPEDFLLLSKELVSVRPTVNLALKLADMPRGRHRLVHADNPIATLLPDQQETRRILMLLNYEAMRLNQKGESKEALRACRALVNTARSLGDEPFFISQLIRIAGVAITCQAIERTLAQGEPPIEEMTLLQKLLENEDSQAGLLAVTRGERAALHKVFELVARGEVSLNSVEGLTRTGSENQLKSTLIDLWRMDTREDNVLFLSLMNRRIEELKRPMPEQAALENQFEQDVKNLPRNALITHLLLPALSKIGGAFRRKNAILRCTIVALAAERYRQEKKEWPEDINQLCPQYLAGVATDPYDGAPLRYRRVRHGVVIYSVGPDAVDNGGNINPENPVQKDTDMGIRLWDTAKRCQPPRPKLPDAAGPQ